MEKFNFGGELYVKERVAISQQVKMGKLEAEKRELVEALMRIAFEVPCCAREEARQVLAKIKKRGEG